MSTLVQYSQGKLSRDHI
jgi:tRNA U38,U39,U40 pseudouridine synthase TruA